MPTLTSKNIRLLDLPVEILEEIASHSVPSRVKWEHQPTSLRDSLDLRLIHPYLLPVFTQSLLKHSYKITINPRSTFSVQHLCDYFQSTGTSPEIMKRYVRHLEVLAENFTQRTTCLDGDILDLIELVRENLQSLDLNLDGHYVEFNRFKRMNGLTGLKRLKLQGESLFTHIGDLGEVTPNLEELEMLAPALCGPSPTATIVRNNAALTQDNINNTPNAAAAPLLSPSNNIPSTVLPFAGGYQAAAVYSVPPKLTKLHISNLNSPSGQSLLQFLPFHPVEFSFTLLHNYDLSDLVFILCDQMTFGTRLEKVIMRKATYVAEDRLASFKIDLERGFRGRGVTLEWHD